MKRSDSHDPIKKVLSRGVQEVIVAQELERLLRSGKKIKLYLGIDPTGRQLHIGHAIALRKLRAFQEMDHHVIFLIGSFTALIGDTSDKESERQPLTQEQIDENFKTYKEQAEKILDFSKVEIRYNGDWLSKLGFADLLQLANKFTVQQMIERDMYQRRLKAGKPIGLHEFLYPLMQGYDSVAMDVDLEIGGNDQLFNMLAGRTLQRDLKGRNKHVMTVQLLEGTDGRKMAKTNNNVINLTDAPGEQYGKIMSMRDELIEQYFLLCTDVEEEEIAEMVSEMQSGANPRDFKMKLAREIVTMYHDEAAASAAEAEFIQIFQKKDKPSEIEERSMGADKMNICDVLVASELASSKSDARRLVQGGGVKIDDVKVENIAEEIGLSTEAKLVQVGKRKFLKVKA
ncbi:tyrosine--tRNA ligase [Candidatus Peregrinibacteria bacterium CG11_big_fil_rev_8_21_14_0_20_46_8]|nr:MAG: tyrosine--tRNA ligase [Candidatus Peregrinibacteria bacterium CG11_big_fil_rev_8_21_14_0_20_46_8]